MLLFWDPCDLYNSTARFEAGGWTDASSTPGVIGFELAGGRYGGGAIRVDSAIGETGRADIPVTIANSRIYLSYALKMSSVDVSIRDHLQLLNVGGSSVCCQILTTPSRGFQIKDADGTTVFTTPADKWQSGVWHRVEVRLDVGVANGELQIRVDGVVAFDSATDTPGGQKFTQGVTNTDLIRWLATTNDNPHWDIDDVVVWDDAAEADSAWVDAFVGDFILISDVPTGNSQDEWAKLEAESPSVADPETLVDDSIAGDHDADATCLESGNITDTRLTYPALPGNVGTILGVGVLSELKKTTGGVLSPENTVVRVRSGVSTDTVNQLNGDLSTDYKVIRGMAHVDPNTSLAWAKAAAEAASVDLVTFDDP